MHVHGNIIEKQYLTHLHFTPCMLQVPIWRSRGLGRAESCAKTLACTRTFACVHVHTFVHIYMRAQVPTWRSRGSLMTATGRTLPSPTWQVGPCFFCVGHILLYFIVLCCVVFYCISLYCTVLYCISDTPITNMAGQRPGFSLSVIPVVLLRPCMLPTLQMPAISHLDVSADLCA